MADTPPHQKEAGFRAEPLTLSDIDKAIDSFQQAYCYRTVGHLQDDPEYVAEIPHFERLMFYFMDMKDRMQRDMTDKEDCDGEDCACCGIEGGHHGHCAYCLGGVV